MGTNGAWDRDAKTWLFWFCRKNVRKSDYLILFNMVLFFIGLAMVKECGRRVEPDIMIVLDNVTKVYHIRRGPRTVLDGINLCAGRGERLGILGRNGSGKSTLIRLISGAELPTHGTYLPRHKRILAFSF